MMSTQHDAVFNATSVRLILADQKTQTRRLAANLRVRLPAMITREIPQSDLAHTDYRHLQRGVYSAQMSDSGEVSCNAPPLGGGTALRFDLKPGAFHFECPWTSGETTLVSDGGKKIWTVTPYEPHFVWVREAYSLDATTVHPCPAVWYRADFGEYDDPSEWTAHGEHTCDLRLAKHWPESTPSTSNARPLPDANCFTCVMDGAKFRWRNPMFMHRRHARLKLEVKTARLMRLHDITTADAIAEGCLHKDYGHNESEISADGGVTYHVTRTTKVGWSYGPSSYSDQCLGSARMAYASAWNDIYGRKRSAPDPWDLNPWVWAYTFKSMRAR